MGDWLTFAPAYLRSDGLTVHVVEGFDTRTRSSSPDGLDSILGLVVHHTVSNFANPADEADFLANRHSVAPVGNFFLDRNGDWWCCAAGATNTNGSGGPRIVSQGVVPLDNGNRTCPAIEAANNGVGEPWNDAQLAAYVKGVAALIKAVNVESRWHLDAGDVFSHSEWAPTRKVDPGGPCRFAPSGGAWHHAIHTNGQTGMDLFRGEVFAALLPEPPPPIPRTELEAMAQFICKDETTTYWIGDGFRRRKLRNDGEVDRWVKRRLRGFVAGQVIKDRETVPTVLPRALIDLGLDVTDQFVE